MKSVFPDSINPYNLHSMPPFRTSNTRTVYNGNETNVLGGLKYGHLSLSPSKIPNLYLNLKRKLNFGNQRDARADYAGYM